jgi:hypothetical protein
MKTQSKLVIRKDSFETQTCRQQSKHACSLAYDQSSANWQIAFQLSARKIKTFISKTYINNLYINSNLKKKKN